MTERTFPDVMTLIFDGRGNAEQISTDSLSDWTESTHAFGFIWRHMRLEAETTPVLLQGMGLDGFVIEALMAEETRPRCTVHGDGVILNLRGVNLHPDKQPEDMISIRLWLTQHRVVGVWRRPLYAVADLLSAIERGQGPVSPGDLVARLALRLADRAEPAIADLNESVDGFEESLLDSGEIVPGTRLGGIRRTSIVLRRYLLPQRDALSTLEIEDLPWLSPHDRSRLREAADRINRLGEELDAIRDRTQVIHDQIMDQRAERLNNRMLLLAIVAAIFLPLGLVTGLLGINVGGIPGQDNDIAFWLVCLLIAVLGAGLWYVAKRLGLFR